MYVLKILKTKRNIDISKAFGNVKITSFHYSAPIKNSDKWKDWTEVSLWYDCDCENCPMGWEDRGYEGECNDCGCLFDNDFNVPIWKCMLPNWIKQKIAKRKRKECPF